MTRRVTSRDEIHSRWSVVGRRSSVVEFQGSKCMNFTIDIGQEDDGRIIAEVLELPGVLAYGQTREEAIARAQALALRVLADRLEHGEAV